MRYSEPSDQTAKMRQVNLVIDVRACHCVNFVVLLLDSRVRSYVEFSLLTVFERGKVNCEFAVASRTLPRPQLHKPMFAYFHFLLLVWTYTAEV